MFHAILFNCNLERLQGEDGVPSSLLDKEVVRKMFEADFRNNSLVMIDPGTNALFSYKYVKTPRDGMFLMEVTNVTDGVTLIVHIDTKTIPDFIMIEKSGGDNNYTYQVARVMECSLCRAAEKYGCRTRITPNELTEVKFSHLFIRALDYIDEYLENQGSFKNYLLVDYKDEVMKLAHYYSDPQTSARVVICVQKVLIDMEMLSNEPPVPHPVFQREFGYGKGRSRSSYSEYLGSKSYVYKGDDMYDTIKKQFLELKNKHL